MQRYGFDTSACPHLAQDLDTSQPWRQEAELERVIEEDEPGVCGGFEGAAEVRGNYIGRREGVGHRVERRSPQSTSHQCSSNLNGSMADEVIAPYRNWHHCDCDCV